MDPAAERKGYALLRLCERRGRGPCRKAAARSVMLCMGAQVGSFRRRLRRLRRRPSALRPPRGLPAPRRDARHQPRVLRRCAVCFPKGLCEPCPAKSWAESGTLDTPAEYLCEVAHEQARDLGLLEPGESAWLITDWKARVERR